MKCEHVDDAHEAGVMTFHAAGVAGFGSGQIWQWLVQYGLPALLKILPIILPLILEKKLTLGQAGKWVAEALAAYAAGKDLPPLPAASAK